MFDHLRHVLMVLRHLLRALLGAQACPRSSTGSLPSGVLSFDNVPIVAEVSERAPFDWLGPITWSSPSIIELWYLQIGPHDPKSCGLENLKRCLHTCRYHSLVQAQC